MKFTLLVGTWTLLVLVLGPGFGCWGFGLEDLGCSGYFGGCISGSL